MSNSFRLAGITFTLFAVTLAVAAQQSAPVQHKHLMVVVSKLLPGITLYDADTDQEICRTTMGISPHEAAFSRDGKTLYVPDYSSANVGAPGTDEHVIHFIRTSDCQIMASMDTGDFKRPHFAQEGPSGLLYVTAELKSSIIVIDPKQQKIVDTIPTGSSTTHFFSMTKDEKKIFTSNVSAGTLSVLDVPGKQILKMVNTGGGNQRMTVSPDDRWFVTSLGSTRQVVFYRTSDYELDFSVEVDGGPFVARFHPDGKSIYNLGTAPRGGTPAGMRVWKIDTATRKVVATSSDTLGTGTGGLQVSPFNGKVYISGYSGQVSVLDPDSLKLLKQFQAPNTPDGLFFGEVR